MLVIESDAVKLWCPQCPRTPIPIDRPSNTCMASKCMWWVQMGPRLNDNYTPTGLPRFGYCGAADKGTP